MTRAAFGTDAMGADSSVDPERSRQLDVFRGVAAMLMVFNHAGFQLLGAPETASGWPGALVFLGSAAPALFFFASGVGSGFGAGRGESVAAVLRKVALLLLADVLLVWSSGALLGFDFFAFAAITVLTMFLVRRSVHPERLALGLVLLVVLIRFGTAPLARGHVREDSLLAFITGNAPVRHVSYPLAPWLAFPLLGFLVGRRWRKGALWEESWIVTIAAALFASAALVLVLRGAPVFRWGLVSIAYFSCALAIVATAWMLTRWLNRWWPSGAKSMALRGPASLLIVPFHYALLGVLAATVPSPWAAPTWLVVTLLLGGCILVISRRLVARATQLAAPRLLAQAGIVAMVVALSALALSLAPPLLRLEVCSAAEIFVALLLLWATQRKSAMK